MLIYLFNRESIGQSIGEHKTAELVYKALSSINGDFYSIGAFHTNRGTEFKNKVTDEALETCDIKKTLSIKGCPYDNAVAEATFKVIKTEFIFQHQFTSLDPLTLELRIISMGSIGLAFLEPLIQKFIGLKNEGHINFVQFSVDNP